MNRVFAWPVGRGQYSLPIRYSLIFALSSTAGGAAIGSVILVLLALTGGLSVIPAVTAILAFVAVIGEALGRMMFLPERRAQVPRDWLGYSPLRFASGFGLMLGFGVVTYLRHPAFYAVLAAVVANGEATVALATGIVFGVTRGLAVIANRAFRSEMSARKFERYVSSPAFELRFRLLLTGVSVFLWGQIMIYGGG